ncbi:hypothetical protein JCM14469_07100 [Desulfatiferula olefinivorans]
MESETGGESGLSAVCRNLAEYAVDREDINALVAALPRDREINTVTVDYELQLLKIVSVGWSLSAFMTDHPDKTVAAETFWGLIRDFSKDISNVTGLMIGQSIDYFQLLRQRLDHYVASLDRAVKSDDPASAIGPAFAAACKADDPFVTITGARVFTYTSAAVKDYLGSQGLSTS